MNKNAANGMNEIDLTDCDSEISVEGQTEILVQTDKSLYQEVVYVDDSIETSVSYIGSKEIQKLEASDGEAEDEFGRGIAMWDDYVVVGALLDHTDIEDSGSLYIYEKSGNSWVQTQKLVTSDGEVSDWLGRSMSIYGDTIVVGSNGKDSREGAAYIFQ